jgi:type II secretory pathway pseudopilin PulG
MRKSIVIGLVAALALAVLGCSSGDDDSSEAMEAAPAMETSVEAAAADDAGGEEAVPVSQPSQGGGSVPSVGPSIVQTAALAISVPRNDFDSTIQRARTIAAGAGGFVVSSSASQGEERRLVRGTLVVRVPERSYARVMAQLADLGRVEAQEEAGSDVSQELVDLQARIRHLEAVEAQLLGFLEEADSVTAALTVQQELNRVQLELEQARGRLVYLEDQVAFATISLEVRERQVAVAEAGEDGGPWGIVDAWRAAGTGFVTVVGWMFVAAATIAPVVLLLVLAFLAARLAGWRGLSSLRRPQA